MRRAWVVGVGFAFAFTTGCGPDRFQPVRGRLVYPDGSPAVEAEKAQVVFEGVGADGRRYSSVGVVGADGSFRLTSEKPEDGAVPGVNQVLITPYIPNPDAAPPKVLDPKFEAFETSGLTAEVKPTGPNDFTFTVEKAKSKDKSADKPKDSPKGGK